MLLATESQIWPEGASFRSGHDNSATQTGNRLVSVRTSETGRRVKAKNVPTRLRLPAMLRIQSVREPPRISFTPPALARMAAKTMARNVRARAITCQSQDEPSAWARVAIRAKDRLPLSIHT